MITTPVLTGIPSTNIIGHWLLPSAIPHADPQLLLLFDEFILYTINISSSIEWTVNQKLSNIQLEFLVRSLSFHLNVVNSTTIACVDNQMTIFVLNLYSNILTLQFDLRSVYPDYPRMNDEIPNNLVANPEYLYVNTSTNVEPFDQQYLFRIALNNDISVGIVVFNDENFGLNELVTSAIKPPFDIVYAFERLYEAEDYFSIYKIGTNKSTIIRP
ncbi:unnamed protein product [Didymodactylos carnosus]|uniref:Uncharacterized protein n=1 Tax=Didymodactylos carnosus TaxID=1234261 RepID=A0A814N2G4_9BILA|nr:unnamed protein product [Didymodactylos carnosus]CAF3852954.1 unnamed protein product [Didymodactylos carnosus]